MDQPDPEPIDEAAIEHAAAEWLVRRDSGFTPDEQDEFFSWLAADPRHGEWLAIHQETRRSLQLLGQWRPEHGTVPNPDLLAPSAPTQAKRNRWFSTLAPWSLAAAAAIAFVAWIVRPGDALPNPPEAAPLTYRTGAFDRLKVDLADGSHLELNNETTLVVDLTAQERNVRLVTGEAHFTVAKDHARPFVVQAGPAFVRAVGTRFNISVLPDAADVLVDEGKVRVSRRRLSDTPLDMQPSPAAPLVTAGQRIRMGSADVIPDVMAASARDVSRILDWRVPKLTFNERRLAEAVAIFNRYAKENATGPVREIVIADPELADLAVDGTFRADNMDDFVWMLEQSAGLKADRAGSTITLRKAE